MNVDEIINRLKVLANPEKVLFKKQKFGVEATNALGIMLSDIDVLVKEIGKSEALAHQLFDTGIYEARILAAKIFPPKILTKELAYKWVVTFQNWEICDTFSMGVFAKSPIPLELISEFVSRKNEFEKRAGFATIASFCMADKKAQNSVYLNFLPVIEREAIDERLYVKKAVNWALRSIGKRNTDLNKAAILCAERILKLNSTSARWIAKDALRELKKDNLNILDYPISIYRV